MNHFELRVNVNNKPVRVYHHDGSNYIEGRKGSTFSLDLVNHTSRKVLMVPSVDGISPLDGKPAGADSPGMIVKPFSTVNIPGWMINLNESSKFEFKDRQNSYTRSVVSHTDNAGVIGLLVFEEEQKVDPIVINIPATPTIPLAPSAPWGGSPWTTPWVDHIRPVWSSTSEYSVGSIQQLSVTHSVSTTAELSTTRRITTADAEKLGVGWGARVDHKVKETSFNKGKLAEQMVLYYESHNTLRRMGVFEVNTQISRPNPFPGIGCTPPAGWSG